jgi:hypothetical protein
MLKFPLLENEKLVKVYRQSEVVLFKPVLVVFILIYFPWYFLLKYELIANYPKLMVAWTLLVFLYAANKYFLWLLNIYLVTNKRLVCVNYHNLLNKQVSETPLQHVLSVSFTIKGFLESLFRYGSVEVRAQGLHEPMLLKNLSQPSKAKDFIWQVRTLPTQKLS